ncbi:MAG: 3D domain-containing protein [Firmicutes bacterium]|nr:3D domain-containing protein [Bacillota bacterium]
MAPADPAASPVRVTATAYDACPRCTGKGEEHPAFGVTAAGHLARVDHTIAVDPDVIPLGTWVYIEGMGIYRAEDTGSAIKGHRIDIFMSTHEEALKFGIRELNIWQVRPAF